MDNAVIRPLSPLPARSHGLPTDRSTVEAARDFEAMFLAEMLRGMTAGLSAQGPLGGSADDPFRSLLADAYAGLVARRGGIGLADLVLEELVRAQEIR